MGLDMVLEDKYHDELAYWGKSGNNFLSFFINKLGKDYDCDIVPVQKEWLEELVFICCDVIANPEKAPELLPRHDDEYDDWYFESLLSAVTQCRYVLKTFDFENETLYFYASW